MLEIQRKKHSWAKGELWPGQCRMWQNSLPVSFLGRAVPWNTVQPKVLMLALSAFSKGNKFFVKISSELLLHSDIEISAQPNHIF